MLVAKDVGRSPCWFQQVAMPADKHRFVLLPRWPSNNLLKLWLDSIVRIHLPQFTNIFSSLSAVSNGLSNKVFGSWTRLLHEKSVTAKLGKSLHALWYHIHKHTSLEPLLIYIFYLLQIRLHIFIPYNLRPLLLSYIFSFPKFVCLCFYHFTYACYIYHKQPPSSSLFEGKTVLGKE